MFYNQLAIQSENRIGVQLGLKWLNFLTLDNSFLCVEFNRIARDLYAIDSVNYIGRTLQHQTVSMLLVDRNRHGHLVSPILPSVSENDLLNIVCVCLCECLLCA